MRKILRKMLSVVLACAVLITTTNMGNFISYASELIEKKYITDDDFVLLGSDTINFMAKEVNISGKILNDGNIQENKDSDIYIDGDIEGLGKTKYLNLIKSIEKYIVDNSLKATDTLNFNNNVIKMEENILCEKNVFVNASNVEFENIILSEENIIVNASQVHTESNAQVVLISKNGDIKINTSELILNGIIYAPNGNVTINSDIAHVKGKIIAKEIYIEGNEFNLENNTFDIIESLHGSDIIKNIINDDSAEMIISQENVIVNIPSKGYESSAELIDSDYDGYEYKMYENGLEYTIQCDTLNNLVYVDNKRYTYDQYMEACSLQNDMLMSENTEKGARRLANATNNNIILRNILEENFEEMKNMPRPQTRCYRYCKTDPNKAPVGGSYGSYKQVSVLSKTITVALTVAVLTVIAAFFSFGAIAIAKKIVNFFNMSVGVIIGSKATGYCKISQARHSKCPIYIREKHRTYIDKNCKTYISGTECIKGFYSSSPY